MAVAGRLSGPEWKRYPDPATELEVVRLTDPAFSSGMTAPHLRQFGRRSDTLLYWSERTGTRQGFQMDLKTGESHQITDAADLDPHSLVLNSDEKSVVYFDGPALIESSLNSLSKRTPYKGPAGVKRTGLTQGFDGSLLFVETRDGKSRILRSTRSVTNTIAALESPVDDLQARPKSGQLLIRSEAAVSLCNLDGSGTRPLQLEPGLTGAITWVPSGRTFVYLHIPDDPKELISLREYNPEEKTDRRIASTSQFESVGSNTDSSVFAGASRSKASAYVLILLRAVRRELTLCEHHASDPRMVSPIFTPDSQSVFFTSDRDGHSAIYRVHVDKFVEHTGEG